METTKWGATNKDLSSFLNVVISEVIITLEEASNRSSHSLEVGSTVVFDHKITSATKSLTDTTMKQLYSRKITTCRQIYNSNNLVKDRSKLSSSSSNNLDTLTRVIISNLKGLAALRCQFRTWVSIRLRWAKCKFKVTSNSIFKEMSQHKLREFQT
jgi:hypothetical protein